MLSGFELMLEVLKYGRGPTILSDVTAMSNLALDKAMFCANLSLGTENGSECKTSQCACMSFSHSRFYSSQDYQLAL